MKNILLVYGGESVESDISVLTALQTLGYINREQYNIVPAYITKSGLLTGSVRLIKNPKNYINSNKFRRKLTWERGGVVKGHKHIKIDCALLATHGGSGENGALQGLLEYYNIAYTSCDHYASKLTMDKYKTLERAANIGVLAPKTYYYRYGADIDYNNVMTMLGGRVVVKPNSLGSSIGVKLVTTVKQLIDAVEVAFNYDNEVILQEAIGNLAELNCAAMIVNKHVVVSDVEQPHLSSDILDFDTKYRTDGKMSGVSRDFPATIDIKLREQVRSWTLKLYRELGLFGVVRIDYLYDKEAKKLYLNEINSIPGSLAYYLFITDKFDRMDFIEALIDSGIERRVMDNRLIKQFDSSLLGGKGSNGGSKLLADKADKVKP